VLWTTKDWEAWPRGLSKAAARVLCDPLFFFTAFAPVWILVRGVDTYRALSLDLVCQIALLTEIVLLTQSVLW